MTDKDLAVGTRVTARYGGDDEFYPGVIAAVNADGTYDVDYDDGDAESGVAAELVVAAEEPAATSDLQVGTRVQCRYAGGDELYPGTVSEVHADGTYDIAYDDGDADKRAPRGWIDRIDNLRPSSPLSSPAVDALVHGGTSSSGAEVAATPGASHAALSKTAVSTALSTPGYGDDTFDDDNGDDNDDGNDNDNSNGLSLIHI